MISNLVRKDYPDMATDFEQLPSSYRLFDLFSLLILNVTCGTQMHKDLKDYHHGFCLLVPFGDYSKGELVFPDIGIEIAALPGDVIAFRSHTLTHGTAPYLFLFLKTSLLNKYTGTRRSLILVNHNTVMNYGLQE